MLSSTASYVLIGTKAKQKLKACVGTTDKFYQYMFSLRGCLGVDCCKCVFERALPSRISELYHKDKVIHEDQHGSLKKKSTTDHIRKFIQECHSAPMYVAYPFQKVYGYFRCALYYPHFL